MLDNKSLASSANYLTDLNSMYSYDIYIKTNNLFVANATFEASIGYFDRTDFIEKEISLYVGTDLVDNANALVQIERICQNIRNTIEDVTVFNNSYVSGINVVIDIRVSTEDTILKNLNIKAKYNSIVKYDLYSVSDTYIQILTNAGLLNIETFDNINNIASQILPHIDEILLVDERAAQVSADTLYVAEMRNDIEDMRENVNLVSQYVESIDLVSNNLDDVVVSSHNISIINTVAENIDSVVIDANNIGNINIVANDLSSAGFSNLMDAGSIADDVELEPSGISNIETVADNILNVNITSNNIDSVNTVSNDIANVNITAENINNINAIGPSINNVDTVSQNIDNIDINALNISSINSVATNIVDIQNAEENAIAAIDSAAAALSSENLAHKWANEAEDIPVIGEYGIYDEYSAYHWSKKAEAAAGGSITLGSLYDVNTTGIVDGGIISYDTTNSVWKSYDFYRNSFIGFNLTSNTAVSTGQLAWNEDEGTLDLGLSGGSVLQIGQENVRKVTNNSGATILDGRLVMYNGTNGNSGRINVKPFTAGFNEALYLYGVATHSISDGADGIITIEGKVRGIDTTGASVGEIWEDNDILYAKPNDQGMLTKIAPADNELKIVVASVIKAHTHGTLEIRFMPFNENMYYNKVQNDILLANKVPLNGDFILDLGGL